MFSISVQLINPMMAKPERDPLCQPESPPPPPNNLKLTAEQQKVMGKWCRVQLTRCDQEGGQEDIPRRMGNRLFGVGVKKKCAICWKMVKMCSLGAHVYGHALNDKLFGYVNNVKALRMQKGLLGQNRTGGNKKEKKADAGVNN